MLLLTKKNFSSISHTFLQFFITSRQEKEGKKKDAFVINLAIFYTFLFLK